MSTWRDRIQRETFPSQNEWGIPNLPHLALTTMIPDFIVPYKQPSPHKPAKTAVHFFTYDFKFNVVWNQPQKGFSAIKDYALALTPDFSLYMDTPRAEQIWNVYRNRWCGAYWASRGMTVIPTVGWSDEKSYAYAFTGITLNSIVAVSTVGIQRNETAKSLFKDGFQAMLEILAPSKILCYGKSIDTLEQYDHIQYYPQYWNKKQSSSQELPNTLPINDNMSLGF